MGKSIANIQEIKDSLSNIKLPEQFKLSESEVITNLDLFINTNLSILSTNDLTSFHRPYYFRLKKVLDTFKINIVIEEKQSIKQLFLKQASGGSK
jgi:hypothetical protein